MNRNEFLKLGICGLTTLAAAKNIENKTKNTQLEKLSEIIKKYDGKNIGGIDVKMFDRVSHMKKFYREGFQKDGIYMLNINIAGQTDSGLNYKIQSVQQNNIDHRVDLKGVVDAYFKKGNDELSCKRKIMFKSIQEDITFNDLTLEGRPHNVNKWRRLNYKKPLFDSGAELYNRMHEVYEVKLNEAKKHVLSKDYDLYKIMFTEDLPFKPSKMSAEHKKYEKAVINFMKR